MDILYIVGKNSKCNDFELRCSLRSLAKYGRNIRKVYVVGNCPDWLSDEVVKLPCEDYNKETYSCIPKAQNIAKKVLYALDNSDIGEDFLISMDDHFYTKPTDFDNYPFYARKTYGYARITASGKCSGEYNQFIRSCGEYLVSIGLSDYNFALHRNMRMSRTAINGCRDIIDNCIKNNIPFETFVLAGNYAFTKGLCIPTIVKDNRLLNGQQWFKTGLDHVFSTADFTVGSGLYLLIKQLYPKKCKYEKDDVVINSETNNRDKKLSVIVPLYNVEKYLDECIASILLSSHSNLELILVDDGSTDNSLSICKEWQKRDNRIKVISEGHRGVSAARNRGIKESTGDWISFIDSDDYVNKLMFEKMIDAGVNHNCQIVRCGQEYHNPDNSRPVHLHEDGVIFVDNNNKQDYSCTTCTDSIYNASLIKSNNIEFPDCEICEDLMFNILLLSIVGKLYNINEPLYHRRKRYDSLSASFYNTFKMTEEKKNRIIRMINARKVVDSRLKNTQNYEKLHNLMYSLTLKYDNMLINNK